MSCQLYRNLTNAQGSTVTEGQLVRLSANNTFVLADNDANDLGALGVALSDIVNGASGPILLVGVGEVTLLTNETPAAGNPVWLSSSAGSGTVDQGNVGGRPHMQVGFIIDASAYSTPTALNVTVAVLPENVIRSIGTRIAIGPGSNTNSGPAIAIGSTAVGSSGTAIALGTAANAFGISIGASADTDDGDGIAIGNSATVAAIDAIGIGVGSIASATQTIAIGDTASAAGIDGIAIGTSAALAAGGAQGVCIGLDSAVSGAAGIAVGQSTQATANSTIAIGDDASATAVGGIAIGMLAVVSGTDGIAIGNSITATANQLKIGTNPGDAVNDIEIGDSLLEVINTGLANDDTGISIAIKKGAAAISFEKVTLGATDSGGVGLRALVVTN